jgi:hypothetical protein
MSKRQARTGGKLGLSATKIKSCTGDKTYSVLGAMVVVMLKSEEKGVCEEVAESGFDCAENLLPEGMVVAFIQQAVDLFERERG